MATWLAEPLARFRAIVEGAYPSVAVPGRSVPAGRFARATYRDDPASLAYTGTGFHRHYLVTFVGARDVPGAAANWRTGRVIKSVTLELRMGYVVEPDGREVRDGSCADEEAATMLGLEDAHTLEEALRWPDFWPGTSPAIAQIRPAADVAATVIVPRRRVLCTSRWELTLDFAPGATWT